MPTIAAMPAGRLAGLPRYLHHHPPHHDPLSRRVANPLPATHGDPARSSTLDMAMTVLALVFVALLLATALVFLRRIQLRRARFMAAQDRADLLPSYQDLQHEHRQRLDAAAAAHAGMGRNPRGLTIHTTDAHGRETRCALVFGRDGQPMLANPKSPPHSPDNVPAIHITFPDEEDEKTGGRRGGRVVVVRVGESGVGLEPLPEEEQLPAYERESKSGFHSVDMDQVGGLKEKSQSHFDYS